MMIIPLEPNNFTPRDELVQEVMLVLDEAIIGDKPVSVFDLAERIVTLLEEQRHSI